MGTRGRLFLATTGREGCNCSSASSHSSGSSGSSGSSHGSGISESSGSSGSSSCRSSCGSRDVGMASSYYSHTKHTGGRRENSTVAAPNQPVSSQPDGQPDSQGSVPAPAPRLQAHTHAPGIQGGASHALAILAEIMPEASNA